MLPDALDFRSLHFLGELQKIHFSFELKVVLLVLLTLSEAFQEIVFADDVTDAGGFAVGFEVDGAVGEHGRVAIYVFDENLSIFPDSDGLEDLLEAHVVAFAAFVEDIDFALVDDVELFPAVHLLQVLVSHENLLGDFAGDFGLEAAAPVGEHEAALLNDFDAAFIVDF